MRSQSPCQMQYAVVVVGKVASRKGMGKAMYLVMSMITSEDSVSKSVKTDQTYMRKQSTG